MFDKRTRRRLEMLVANGRREEEVMDYPYWEKAEQKKREEEPDDQITEVSDLSPY